MDVRAAEGTEIDRLAEIWFDGWQDAHAEIVPVELVEVRTRESFPSRLRTALQDTRVAGPLGSAVGFYILKDDEVYQFYVAAQARGSGVATTLMTDAEERLRAKGVRIAWLSCAIGNHRAARFYEKCGWHRVGTMTENLEVASGILPLKVWRYEKPLTLPGRD